MYMYTCVYCIYRHAVCSECIGTRIVDDKDLPTRYLATQSTRKVQPVNLYFGGYVTQCKIIFAIACVSSEVSMLLVQLIRVLLHKLAA